MVTFDVKEQNLLLSLLFGDDTKSKANMEDSNRNLNMIRVFKSLCRHCSRPSKLSETLFKLLDKEEIRHGEQIIEIYPIVVPGTVCLFCLGDDSLVSHARIYAFARRSSLARSC